jgi:hypothetical protein
LNKTFKNWFFRRKQVFSNIPLYGIPYTFITDIEQFDIISEGFCLFDELWSVCDSRMSLKKKNSFVSRVLGRSRKRHLNISFTAQMVDQLDKRVRKICDFTSYPILSSDESLCKVNVFRTGYPKDANYIKTFWYKTAKVFNQYDTDYIVEMGEEPEKDEEGTLIPVKQPPIYFQENKDAPREEFPDWVSADSRAEMWWNKHQSWLKEIF